MHEIRLAARSLWRDLKAGEMTLLLLALFVAVASLTAVSFFTDRIGLAVAQQAGEVLAADLRISSAREISPKFESEAKFRGLRTARVVTMPSVVFHGTDSSLVALRAVGDGYPLRGRLKVADEAFGKARETDELPGRGEAWADSRLLAALGASIGARLRVGAHELKVSRVLDYRPDQGTGFADLSATLLINLADLPATQLLQPGSRVRYATLFAGNPQDVRVFRGFLEENKSGGERLESIAEASPQIKASADRAGRFLSLASLVSVLLASVAVAMTARRYVSRHLDNAALMKCMGVSQGLVLRQTLLQLVVIALLVGVVGTAGGYLAQGGLAWLLRDLVPEELPVPSMTSGWIGMFTAVMVLVGFALPPLLQLKNVPPARVLKRDLAPPSLRYGIVYGLAILTILALLLWIVRDVKLIAYVSGGLLATFAALAAGGWLLVRMLTPLRRRAGGAWRYGLANISRRGRESIVQIVAFGLGLMVLLLLALVRNDLLDDWKASLPNDAPNYFMINIRPDEGDALRTFFEQQGLPPTEMVPLVRARLTQINGIPVDELQFQSDRARRFVEREGNLTWSRTLGTDNELLEGEWWRDGDDGEPRVSVEREFAEELGLKIGDTVTHDVSGEPVTARVASIREVRWDSFRPNFFMVFSPGVLDGLVGTLITSVHVEAGQREALVDLVRRFPEVTIIDIDALLGQVRGVMDKAALAVQYVFMFTLFAGLAVLLAAIQSTLDERRYESAMLRTLGASRRVVLAGVAAEFTALGLLSGLLAAAGATGAGFFLARELFGLTYAPDARVWVAGAMGGAVLVGVAGVLATRSVITHPPMTTLRQVP